jgi:hypothetical protein
MNPPAPKLQPAVYGGLFIGVLSALPIINIGNCCCLWVIGGGVLATYLMQQNHPYPVATADGALAGLMAGVIGGIVGTLLSIPIMMMMGPFQKQFLEGMLARNAEIPEETRRMLENMNTAAVGAAAMAIKLVFSVCIGAVFGMLGGLLGVALFKKKDLPPPTGTYEVLPPA